MKTTIKSISLALLICFTGFTIKANLLNPPQNGLTAASQSSLFAAFTGLTNAVYNSGSGALSLSNFSILNWNQYHASASSPGTHGNNNSNFLGQFFIDSTITSNAVDHQWEVTRGTIQVFGNLLTGNSQSTLLLSGNLVTGANSLGYLTNSPELDFVFKVTGGVPQVYNDFLGGSTTNLQGAVYVTMSQPYTDFATHFATAGNAIAFVPQIPQIQGGQIAGGMLKLSFPTVSSQSYTIQQTSNFLSPNWMTISNFTGNGSSFELDAPTTNGPQLFYRVRQP